MSLAQAASPVQQTAPACALPRLRLGLSWLRPRIASRPALFAAQMVLNTGVGFLFARLLGRHYGISEARSGFEIAFSVPLMIVQLSGFAYLHSVFVTEFSRLRLRTRTQAETLFSSLLNTLLLLCGVVAVAGLVCSGPAAQWLASGLSAPTVDAVRLCMVVMLPLTVVFGASFFLAAVSQAYEIPIGSEFLLLLSRLALVVYLVLSPRPHSLEWLSFLLLAFGVVSLVIQVWIFRRCVGLTYRPRIDFRDRNLRAVLQQAAPFLVVAVVNQAVVALVRRLATFDSAETVAALTFAMGLVMPVISVLGKSAAFTLGARFVATTDQGDVAGARRMLTRRLIQAVGASLAAVGALYLAAPWLVRVLFRAGQFDEFAVETVSQMARVLLWMVPFAVVVWAVNVPALRCRWRHASAGAYLLSNLGQGLTVAVGFTYYGRAGLLWSFVVANAVQAVLGCLLAVQACKEPRHA